MILNTIQEEEPIDGPSQKVEREDNDETTSQLKVVYEIKIVCIMDLDMPDGSAVQINWHRGNQTLDTNTKVIKSKRAYFLQKF